MATSFRETAETFSALPGWRVEDQPGLAALVAIGAQIDEGYPTPALWSQWGLCYRALNKAREERERPTELDPLDDLLKR